MYKSCVSGFKKGSQVLEYHKRFIIRMRMDTIAETLGGEQDLCAISLKQANRSLPGNLESQAGPYSQEGP